MAGLLRNISTKVFLPSSHTQLGVHRLPAAFVSVRCMGTSKLFVGGLSFNTDETSLKNAFSAHGEVLEAKIILDRNTGMSRGFGFITFNSDSEAEAAFKAMNGQVVNGRVIRVDYATNKPAGGGGFQRRSDVFYPSGGGRPGQDSSFSDTGVGGFQRRADMSYPSAGIRPGQDSGPSLSDTGGEGSQRSGGRFGQDFTPSLDFTPSYASSGGFQSGGRPGQDFVPNYSATGGLKSGSWPINPSVNKNNNENTSGWSQASPTAEDFGPESPKIGKGPNSLQGGYEYKPPSPASSVAPPVSASASPTMNIGNDPSSTLGSSTSIPGGQSSPVISNDTGSAYPKSGPRPILDDGPDYAKSSSAFSIDAGKPVYPNSSPGISDGVPTASGSPSFSTSSSTFRAGRPYPRSRPSYPTYPNKNIGFDLTSDIGLDYPKSTPFSVGSTYSQSSPGLSGAPSGANSNDDTASNKVPLPEQDPMFPGAYVDTHYDPNRKSIFADNTVPIYAKSSTLPPALAYKRSLSVNTGPTHSKSSTAFPDTNVNKKNNSVLSENTGASTTISGGLADPSVGASSSVNSNNSEPSSSSVNSNSSEPSGPGGSGNPDVEPKYAQGGV